MLKSLVMFQDLCYVCTYVWVRACVAAKRRTCPVCQQIINGGVKARWNLQVWCAENVTIWRPQAPPDFEAMGCVATLTDDPPPLKQTVVCLHKHALVEVDLGECLVRSDQGSMWAIENAGACFMFTTECSMFHPVWGWLFTVSPEKFDCFLSSASFQTGLRTILLKHCFLIQSVPFQVCISLDP